MSSHAQKENPQRSENETAYREPPSLAQVLEGDADNKETQKVEDALVSLASGLRTTFKKYVSLKEPIERRMISDLAQYHGKWARNDSETLSTSSDINLFNAEYSQKEQSTDSPKKSSLVVNITRPKTDAAESRMSGMLFPGNDRNWDIEPTPNPEMSGALANSNPVLIDGKPVQNINASNQEDSNIKESDLAQAQQKDILKRCEKMRMVISDQLIESQADIESRKVIRDSIQLGTGILKGPMQIGKINKLWVEKATQDGEHIHVLEVKASTRPYVYRVSPWDFYPDMTASKIEDSEKTFEVHRKTRLQMLELLQTPGFISRQIKKVLEGKNEDRSQYDATGKYVAELRRIAGIDSVGFLDNRFLMVEYHGAIDNEILVQLGVPVDVEDPLQMTEVFVWFVEDIVIKIAPHHLDSKDKLYSVTNWEQDDASIFGYGVPYTLRAPQKVTNASWRMVMDNAGLSTGPQIVINQALIQPADGTWQLTPRKLWLADEEDIDIEKAFKTFNIDSHQNELLQIFYEAKKLAEEESNLPKVMEGAQGTAGRSFSGLSMIMNAGNINLKRAVRYYDDNITITMLKRMYDWNMQFNPDNSIKGDYEVQAKGSSELMVKELQSQGLMMMLQFASNPIFGRRINVNEALREIAKSLHLNSRKIIRDEQEVLREEKEESQQVQEQAPSPDTQIRAEAQVEVAKIKKSENDDELRFKLLELQTQTEIAMQQLAVEQGVSEKEIRSRYAAAMEKNDWDAEKFYTELAYATETGKGI